MRRETVGLVRKAVAENRQAYGPVNHRAKWNSPLTVVQGLVGMQRG